MKRQVTDGLEKMLLGGIYDHVGGGLCRYSTDEQWLVPHFEKMLYDNAQLIDLSILAHAETGYDLFRDRIEETIDWLEREMRLPGGAYASSLDADSEGEEGKFYLWTETAITAVLGDAASDFLASFHLVSPHGWEGDPILVRTGAVYDGRHDTATRALLEARESRTRPGRDDKALTDWNGLVISALASAARYFGNGHWRAAAERAFSAILASKDATGRLPHSVNGAAKLFPAMSHDYAAMIAAAVSLYELTVDRAYLDTARIWAALLDEDHGDGDGGHYLTSSKATDVPIRIRGDIDEATPSATAQIVGALARLASATGDIDIHDKAYRAASKALGRAIRQSHGHAGIFNSACIAANSAKLVVVDDESDPKLARIVKRYPDPRRVDIVIGAGSSADSVSMPGASLDTAHPGAWLCRGQTCLPPVRTATELENLLAGQS